MCPRRRLTQNGSRLGTVNKLLDTLRAFGLVRVLALAGVAIGVLGAFLMLELHGVNTSRMTLLVSDLDSHSLQQAIEELDRRRIPYRMDESGGQIFVPDSEVSTARATLTKAGLSVASGTGYEIFDRGDDFSATDFDQQVKLTRALEGELARTIQSVRGIVRARVHLVLPRREPFAREQREAQASVMLTLAGRQILPPEAVQSIVDLVAAGVPGLKPQNVTVVDSNLHLLVQAGDADDPRLRSLRAEDVRHRLELRLAQGVEDMLERSLGPGHVHAEASIRMNFDKVNETEERYDPDGSVVRSTQTVNSSNKTTEKAAPVSLQNNLPNADASSQASGSQEARQEETTNYEVTKTVRAIIHDQPQVERIALAVMVDGVDSVGADGKHIWKPRPQAELDRIEKLVKTAIGYDQKRGDQVDVVSMPFVSTADESSTDITVAPEAQRARLMTIVQMVAFSVVGIGVILLTARSVFAGLARPPASVAVTGPAGEALPGATGLSLEPQIAAGAPRGITDESPPPEDDEMVTLNRIQGQMRASSIRKVGQLVDRYPDATLGIVRGWIASDTR
ncbi:flagellar M-ring protein FliF [Rhodopila globiformis]|uniref:Flagellar M-ring protein n=1 Tax=Rhodopila globiformis TaxID=1071 RepID=A0A2S6NJ72_RHOGL|nr:flagellar M-ring protein FliF [Rhodopila globiformis]